MISLGQIYPWQGGILDQLVEMRAQDRLPHALLFSGAEYLGKKDFAQAFASSLLCDIPENNLACGECRACKLIIAGSHPDLKQITPEDSGQIKIDAMRDLLSWAYQTSQRGGQRIAVIYPAEKMNVSTSNAFLKCLEEPPSNSVFLLVTNHPTRLIATIRSRCQRLDFPHPDNQTALEWLKAEMEDPPLACEQLLEIARGLPLKATRLYSGSYIEGRQKFIENICQLRTGDAEPLAVANSPGELEIPELISLWMDLVLAAVQHQLNLSRSGTQTLQGFSESTLDAICGGVSQEWLFGFYNRLVDGMVKLKGPYNINARLLLESLLIDWSARKGVSSLKSG